MTTRRPPTILDPDEVRRLREQGLSTREIAIRLGGDRHRIQSICKEIGLNVHVTGVRRAALQKAQELGYPDLTTAIETLAPTMRAADLAAYFDVPYGTMQNWINKCNARTLHSRRDQPDPDADVPEPAAEGEQPPDEAAMGIEIVPVLLPLAPRSVARPLHLGREERWCSKCGETAPAGRPCQRCGRTRGFVDPRLVLAEGEYMLA